VLQIGSSTWQPHEVALKLALPTSMLSLRLI
jgi:hypothetical protein